MKKLIELYKVRQGETFTLDGVEFIKLSDEQGAVFALTADVVLQAVPFEANDEDRDDNNNFGGSSLEKSMERWVQSKPHIYDALLTRGIDLTTMDGMTDYGCPLAIIRALTIDDYRKYRKFITVTGNPYWLATGHTTNNSPYASAASAYNVNADGTLNSISVYYASFAARPALYLKSSILVSAESKKQKALADYTNIEIAKELYKRQKLEEGG